MISSTPLHTVTVELAERSYPVHIGPNLLTQAALIVPHLVRPKVVIVTNTVIAPLYLEALRAALESHQIQVDAIILPDGESHKDWTTLNTIFDSLLSQHAERKTTLIALGGGVIGDLCGFAAAIFQRGAPFIQIPTTLLAQVDSAVGGKTAINHPLGKNMIGAFYQPKLVLADTATLNTLPDRELSAGLAEVIKYGLIGDAQFFDWLELHLDDLLARDPTALSHAIAVSCRNKAQVVASDEREEGVRAHLNFGHTFGHAIESGLGYGQWLHGEAVGCGMVMAAHLSQRLGLVDAAFVARLTTLIQRAGLPVTGFT